VLPTSPFPEEDVARSALALAALPGVGGARYRELLARYGGPSIELTRAGGIAAREAALATADRALEGARACGAAVWLSGAAPYPAALLDLPDPPPHLFALGDPAALQGPVVAVVGTRSATGYGERVTAQIVAGLAAAGACVVSGMATGIDAAAHRAALDAGGRTVAVLGTGVDVPYPAAHRTLHRRIVDSGAVLSEHPPGARATPGSFPRRNRLIAALAQVTIVIEAGHKSGALITAGHALDLGRAVAAVPGPIDAPHSAGTNELIRDGAAVVTGVDDALMLLGLSGSASPASSPSHRAPELSGDERIVWNGLAVGPLELDALASRTALPIRRCLNAVTALELSGLLECTLGGEIRRR
jgi:DNA processing protein